MCPRPGHFFSCLLSLLLLALPSPTATATPTATPPPPLPAPGGVSVDGNTVSWDPVPDASGYLVQRLRNEPGVVQQPQRAEVPASQTRYTWPTPTPDGESGARSPDAPYTGSWLVQVVARGDGAQHGDSPESETVAMGQLPQLDAPEQLAISGNRVSWNVVEGARGYRVRWRQINVEWQQKDVLGGTQTGTDLAGLAAGVTYEVKVKALGDGVHESDSDWSDSYVWTVPPPTLTPSLTPTPPPTPTGTLTPTPTATLMPRLDKPSDLRWVPNTFSWNKVANAIAYKFGLATQAPTKISGMLPRSPAFVCDPGKPGETERPALRCHAWLNLAFPPNEDWTLFVKAVGDGVNFADSEEATLPVGRLAPTPVHGFLCGSHPDITPAPGVVRFKEVTRTGGFEFLDSQNVHQCTTWTQSLCMDANKVAQADFVEGAFNFAFGVLGSLAPGSREVNLLATGITSAASSIVASEIRKEFDKHNGAVVYENGGSMRQPEPCFQGPSMPAPILGDKSYNAATDVLQIKWTGMSASYEIAINGTLLDADVAKARYDWQSPPGNFPGTFRYVQTAASESGPRLTFRIRTLAKFRYFGERGVRPPSDWVSTEIDLSGPAPPPVPTIDICPVPTSAPGSRATQGRSGRDCVSQLPMPTGLRLVGSRVLCWQYPADGHQQGFRVWREPVPDFIRSAGAASQPVTVSNRCHLFPVVQPRDTLYVRALGDGLRFLNSQPARFYVGSAAELTGTPTWTPTPRPSSTPVPPPSATPAPTQNPSLPRLPSPTNLKWVRGSILCWRNVDNATGYTAWNGDPFRAPPDLPDEDAGRDSPCGGGGLGWSFTALTATPGDWLYVIALGDNLNFRNSSPASLQVPAPKPTAAPNDTPAPPATDTPVPTAAPRPQQLPAPGVVRFVGQTLCWKRVANASGYNVRITNAGPRGESDVSPRVDPDPCGTPGSDWQSRHYASPSWGSNYCVKARGDGLRFLDSRERCTQAPQPPRPTARPPTSVPATSVPPTSAPQPTTAPRRAVYVFYTDYHTYSVGHLCYERQRRCRKTCWEGTDTCWNFGQACTEWSELVIRPCFRSPPDTAP